MMSSDLTIATMTLARDDAEARMLALSLRALDAHGIRMFIADGGSPSSFVDEVRSLRSVTLVANRGSGLVAQVRASIAAAAANGTAFVLYTEPDKLDFFDHHLATFIATPAHDDTGIVIASRSPSALATFPAMQRATESAINAVCAELVGCDADFCYGPFVMNARLSIVLDELDDSLGWGWRFAMFVAAHRAGLRVDAVVGEFACPADQRGEDERDRYYRIAQLRQNVSGIEHHRR